MTMHAIARSCPVAAELARLGRRSAASIASSRSPAIPNTGKSTLFNALTGPAAAHRQLAGQDGHARRGRVRVRRRALQARRPARHLLAAVGLAGRRGRARLPALRPARLHGRRRRRQRARAQPQSGAAGARDHRPGRRRRQPDGRGAPARASRSTRAASRATSACRSCRSSRAPARDCHGAAQRRRQAWPRGEIADAAAAFATAHAEFERAVSRAGAAHRSGRAGRAQRPLDCDPPAGRRRRGRRGARDRRAGRARGPPAGAGSIASAARSRLQGAQ